MVENSCYGCKERHVACHDKCEKYKAWKAEMQKAALAKQEITFERNEIYNYINQSKERYKRRVGKK